MLAALGKKEHELMLVSKLTNHKEKILKEFKDAMEFKAFTDLAYLLATNVSEAPGNNSKFTLGYSEYANKFGLTDQEVNIKDLKVHFENAKTRYLDFLVHQQQVSLFEHSFFDLLKILLLDKPERLSKKKQIDYGAIIEADCIDDLISKLVERELNEIKYKNVSEWFNYLEKLIGLLNIEKSELERISEAKASRDIIVHNAGIVNEIYIKKSGDAARFNVGENIDVSGHYTRDTWIIFLDVLTGVIDKTIEKHNKSNA
ncbi:hypothetical protein [Litoribrevibacter albus]|nr:hypothetical protein [Litoribrevibacter albus]